MAVRSLSYFSESEVIICLQKFLFPPRICPMSHLVKEEKLLTVNLADKAIIDFNLLLLIAVSTFGCVMDNDFFNQCI